MQHLKKLLIHSILSIGLVLTFLVSQIFGTLMFAPVFIEHGANLSVEQQIVLGSQHGTVMSLTAILALFIVLLVSLVLIKLQTQSFDKFMAIAKFDFKDLLKFGSALLCLNLLFHVMSLWLDLDSMQFMTGLSDTANPLWLLVWAVVVVIPIYEEWIFRGFIWSGFANSVLGVWGASVITSMAFAVVHLQYGVIEWLMIFVLAMLFSLARIKTGSLWLPICLHMLNNALAVVWFFAKN